MVAAAKEEMRAVGHAPAADATLFQDCVVSVVQVTLTPPCCTHAASGLRSQAWLSGGFRRSRQRAPSLKRACPASCGCGHAAISAAHMSAVAACGLYHASTSHINRYSSAWRWDAGRQTLVPSCGPMPTSPGCHKCCHVQVPGDESQHVNPGAANSVLRPWVTALQRGVEELRGELASMAAKQLRLEVR